MSTARDEISAAVAEALREEARRNEHRVGVVRLWAFALVLVLDVVLAFAGIRPWANLSDSVVWVAISAVLLAVIARVRFRWWMPFAMPAFDAFLVDRIIGDRILALGLTVGLAAISALSCGILAATGGVRFDRRAAVWTTLLAAGVVWHRFYGLADVSGLLYSLVGIFALGLLNLWITDLVRRSMEAARGRLVLGRFLPPALVEDAFRGRLQLLGAPVAVEATVLVSDLRGFTALSETLAPAEVLALLSKLQGRLADAVQAEGGVVDKFMGDGMLAVFGVAGNEADHALRALRAARAILDAVGELNCTETLPRELRVGIGIHSGSVVAGCIGSGDRLEFTVIGDTVNTASRLESTTKELGVDLLASESTVHLSGLQLLPLGEVQLRGRAAKVRVFGLPPSNPPISAAAAR